MTQRGSSFNYVADAADNLTTIRSTVSASVNADNQSANVSQNYDGNGNPTDFLQYDLNDRLIDVKYLTGTVNHLLSTYRSDGLRASKQINANGSVGTPPTSSTRAPGLITVTEAACRSVGTRR